jgi:nitrate ABC transporter ATP-binding subunit
MVVAVAETRPDAVTPQPATDDVVLACHGVGRTFPTSRGPERVLHDVSVNIKRGQFVAFIGHSGCGKTTLLNMVAGLIQPTDGSILLEGKPVQRPGPDRAMVFQNYSLLPWMTVRANVLEAVDSAFPGQRKSDTADQTDRFLQLVGLHAAAHKHPHQLSGGMKQRAAIARAFAVHPKVLLLDEPFGALDALTKSALHDQLLKMWSLEGQTETVLMVTHDVDEALYLADRVVVMTPGPSATIGQVIDVDLPRPRDKRAMVHLPEYADLKDRLLYLLMDTYRNREAND